MAKSKGQDVVLLGFCPEIDRQVCVQGRGDLGTTRPHTGPHPERVREVRRRHREATRRAWPPPNPDSEAAQLDPPRPAVCRRCPGAAAAPAGDRGLKQCEA